MGLHFLAALLIVLLLPSPSSSQDLSTILFSTTPQPWTTPVPQTGGASTTPAVSTPAPASTTPVAGSTTPAVSAASTTPGVQPSTTPNVQPSTTPNVQPSTTPNAQPSTTPNVQPSTTPSSSGCPSGWTPSKTVTNKCYYAGGSTTPDSWSNALAQCQALDSRASLISIVNGFENTEVADLVPGAGFLWLGLHFDNGAWAWVDGQALGYTNWAPGEPNSAFTSAKINRGSVTWQTDSPDNAVDVACELYLS